MVARIRTVRDRLLLGACIFGGQNKRFREMVGAFEEQDLHRTREAVLAAQPTDRIPRGRKRGKRPILVLGIRGGESPRPLIVAPRGNIEDDRRCFCRLSRNAHREPHEQQSRMRHHVLAFEVTRFRALRQKLRA